MVRKRRRIVVVVCGCWFSFEGPRNEECLSGGGVSDQGVALLSEVVVDVEVSERSRGKGVVVHADVLRRRVGGADESVELHRDNMILGEVAVGGSVEKPKGSAAGVRRNPVPQRSQVKREAVSIGDFG